AACVMTFEPHPREYFNPRSAPSRLTSLRDKLSVMSDMGVEEVIILPFNHDTAAISAINFVERLVYIGMKSLLVGDDFRFGARRAGDYALLESLASPMGFGLSRMPSVMASGVRISSTTLRQALEKGDLTKARELLGRPYSMSGRVVAGQRIGRTLGFPTANVKMNINVPPMSGIFAVQFHGISEKPLPGAASLGTRPTVTHSTTPVLEVHLIDFKGNIYGNIVRVEFMRKLRDEIKYSNLGLLAEQIHRDVEEVRDYFGQLNESVT
ncbi:MAG: bifunctional riboflavin kinase/FAD synthetase, partial [Pseudomonadota bacterium]|nr:bifunctional riboflavin kinase/FAD synthetase [Pseudomonadota bacterium]